MKSIPRILKGQEAKDFLEWYETDKNGIVYNESNVATFYSQPFSPAMITKYFQGWEHRGAEYWGTEGQPERIRIISPHFAIRYDNALNDIYPDRLNDFVANCVAGAIELIWKK